MSDVTESGIEVEPMWEEIEDFDREPMWRARPIDGSKLRAYAWARGGYQWEAVRGDDENGDAHWGTCDTPEKARKAAEAVWRRWAGGGE